MKNSLTQYVELYDSQRDVIDANSAPALNARRAEARERLGGDAWLPTRRTADYEATSINDLFAPDLGLNLQRVNIPVDIARSFKCNVPAMSTLQAFLVNDSFVGSPRLDRLHTDTGIRVMSLRRAAVEMPRVVEKYYGRIADGDDTAVALNTMLAQDGVMIHVPRGVQCPRPVQLTGILSAPVSLMAVRRLLIVLEEDAHLQVLSCDHTQDCERDYAISQVTEIALARNARLDWCEIEESSERTAKMATMKADLAGGAALNLTAATLACGTSRNNYFVDLNGEHAEARLAGMVVNSDRRHADNCTRVRHLAPRCRSNQLFKYVLDGESQGAFEGEIYVDPKAKFTEAYQSNRNILAAPTARMHSSPRLLIYDDDVKCSHGSSTGQLDNEALFYMRTRGIPADEARTMLMQAFMVDVIDHVAIEEMRDRLRHLVEMRFRGDDFCDGSCMNATRHKDD